MRYFSRGWVNGEFDDDESERAREAYAGRLDVITSRMPEPARELARSVDLHDVQQLRS